MFVLKVFAGSEKTHKWRKKKRKIERNPFQSASFDQDIPLSINTAVQGGMATYKANYI